MKDQAPPLSPELLLHAYASGVFPMSEHRDSDEVFWVEPKLRGILPIRGFHISRSLSRAMRLTSFHITYDKAFDAVVQGCADREETWINQTIFDLYCALFEMGFAHSVEVWDGKRLVGGSYGVALGGAFFGESMFSRETNASKFALAWLMHRLDEGGFTLFDTQFLTPHLATLGGYEIPKAEYQTRLAQALQTDADFDRQTVIPSAYEVIQRNAQTS